MSTAQAKSVRDCRGVPEFTYNPQLGESYGESFDLKGNPNRTNDWWERKFKNSEGSYEYNVAHWAITEARFRKHHKVVSPEAAEDLELLDDLLLRIVQQDIVKRRVFDPKHRAFVTNFGAYIKVEDGDGFRYHAVSRQMVLFAVERRKAWRMLQSKAGIVNKDYLAQKADSRIEQIHDALSDDKVPDEGGGR